MTKSCANSLTTVSLGNAAEDGKEYMGSFGNIRITLTFLNDKVCCGNYEILGDDKSGARFAKIAIDLAKGQDIDDLPDITAKKILAVSGDCDAEAKRYARYASGALGFVTTRVHRVAYDGFIGEMEKLADESSVAFVPEAFRGFGACSGCSNAKPGGCASPTVCNS